MADTTTALEAFWTDAAVRQATVQFQNEQKENAQSGTDAGAATAQQKDELHTEQEQRARVRESMEQAGQHAPSPEGQMERLRELEDEREQAEDILNNDHG